MRAVVFAALLLPAAAAADTTADLAPEARALLGRWLDAQNRGDFAAYQALYATRFTGVRRSGPRTVKLDRKGWLADRARMFKKKMTVTATEVTVVATPAMARLGFTQTWESGNYKDTGPKELVLVREGAEVKIAREELLRSEVARSPRPETERDRFLWAVDGGLLLDDAPDESWASGPKTVDLGDPVVASRKVEAKRLPPSHAVWLGRRVTGWGPKGQVCEAAVRGFRMVSRAVPHFGQRQEWQEASEKTVAKEAWDLGGKALVADVDGTCKDVVWFRSATLPPPALALPKEPPPAVAAAALAAFRKLPAWKKLQAEYRAAGNDKGYWDESAKPQLLETVRGGKPITLVTVTVAVWEGCGDGFQRELWGLWEVSGGDKPRLTLRNQPGNLAVQVIGAVDTDGDGTAELLFQPVEGDFGTEKGLVSSDGDGWDGADKVTIPFLDCPC